MGHYRIRARIIIMPRIYVPEIRDDIVNELTTIESTLEWIKRLEIAKKRMEEELQQIRTVLKFVVYPTFDRLNKEKMLREK
jgi:hypothetical protein